MSTFQSIGDRVLVAQELGLPAAEAEIVANNWHRPHLVQVAFGCSGTAEWIFRSRIAGPAGAAGSLLPHG